METSNENGLYGGTDYDAEASSPSWSTPSTVSTVATDCGPRCARVDGVDWVVSRGEADNYVWYTNNKSGDWSMPNALGAQTYCSPAIAEHDGKIYVFWTDASNNRIYYATYDGISWTTTAAYYVTGSMTSQGPAATSWNGNLYVAWNAKDDNTLSYSWFNGQGWYNPQTTSFSLQKEPALAVFDNTLYGAICDTPTTGLVPLRYTGSEWVNEGSVGEVWNHEGPALASDSDELLLMWVNPYSSQLRTSTLADAGNGTWGGGEDAGYNMATNYSPGLCGDSTGFRAVWTGKGHSIWTSTRVPGQPTPPPPPPPTTDRPVPPEIQTAAQNLVWGDTQPNYYVTITVTNILGHQLAQAQTQAQSDGSWIYTLDLTLSQGMKVQAVASVDKDSTPSDAYVKVIDQTQTDRLKLTSVETSQVSGVAPDTGQTIKGWRRSDGTLMVNYPVPAPTAQYDGKTFTAPYLKNLQLAEGDMLCVVSQFPNDGNMTPYERELEGYSGS